jgi:hypothetical protein
VHHNGLPFQRNRGFPVFVKAILIIEPVQHAVAVCAKFRQPVSTWSFPRASVFWLFPGSSQNSMRPPVSLVICLAIIWSSFSLAQSPSPGRTAEESKVKATPNTPITAGLAGDNQATSLLVAVDASASRDTPPAPGEGGLSPGAPVAEPRTLLFVGAGILVLGIAIQLGHRRRTFVRQA